MEVFGISERQAFRYLRKAEEAAEPLPAPEAKVALTVKLPIGLIGRVRRQASHQAGSLGEFVASALEAYLTSSALSRFVT